MPGQTPERLYTSSLKSTDVYGLTSYSPSKTLSLLGVKSLGDCKLVSATRTQFLPAGRWVGTGVIMGIEGRPQISAPITPAQSMDLPD